MFFKKNEQDKQGYSFKPRQYDREEKIALQKIVSNIPVARKLLSQELLVTATNNFVAKNLKIEQRAAHNVNTTKNPQLFFQSLRLLEESSTELQKVEPYWRFKDITPTEQLEDLKNRRHIIIKSFIADSFETLMENLEKKSSALAKQKIYDEYQSGIINNLDACGEENFEYFKDLCRKNLNIQEQGEQD